MTASTFTVDQILRIDDELEILRERCARGDYLAIDACRRWENWQRLVNTPGDGRELKAHRRRAKHHFERAARRALRRYYAANRSSSTT